MPKAPLKLKELLKRVKRFGVVPMASARGKGSEIIPVKPYSAGAKNGPRNLLIEPLAKVLRLHRWGSTDLLE